MPRVLVTGFLRSAVREHEPDRDAPSLPLETLVHAARGIVEQCVQPRSAS
jgi:hypothetical protein